MTDDISEALTHNSSDLEHAILAPSSAHAWTQCLASPAMQYGIEEDESPYAEEGTLAHEIAAKLLRREMSYREWCEQSAKLKSGKQELLGYVQRTFADAAGKDLHVEQRLLIEEITGETGAHGTSDAVIIGKDELIIRDLKFGMGVKVFAEGNEQLAVYAKAALIKHGHLGIKKVTFVIDQPRLYHLDSWSCAVEELEKIIGHIRERAAIAWKIYEGVAYRKDSSTKEERKLGIDKKYFAPSKENCQFCKAHGKCHAQQERVLSEIAYGFEDLTQAGIIIPKAIEALESASPVDLSVARAAIPFIKDWILAVERRVITALLRGETVSGWKIVEGKRGKSTWIDKAAAVGTLCNMGIENVDLHEMKLLTPTKMKSKFKSRKDVVKAIAEMSYNPKGKPNVVDEFDERPPMDLSDITTGGFDDLTKDGEDQEE